MSYCAWRRSSAVCLLVGVVFWPAVAGAIKLDDPQNFEVAKIWSGASLGVPGNLGALMFSQDGKTLYVVGNAEASNSAVYAVAVTRDATTGIVTDLGPAATTAKVFDGTRSGLDTGLEVGPEGTLFYTYWQANYMGQRPGGFTGKETAYNMADVKVPSSIAGLTFSPHLQDPGTGFAQMQISSWQGSNLYNIPLTPSGGGLFQPKDAVLFVTLPQQGTGAIQYIPSGKLAGNLMYVNWNYGEIRLLTIDATTGLPIDVDTNTPTLGTAKPADQRFASEVGVGPWGLEFDPRSRDFFVSTWNGNPANSIIRITGSGFGGPVDAGTRTGDAGNADAAGSADASVGDAGAADLASATDLANATDLASATDAGVVDQGKVGCGCQASAADSTASARHFGLGLLIALLWLLRSRRDRRR